MVYHYQQSYKHWLTYIMLTRKDCDNQRVIAFPQQIHNTWRQGVTVLLEESCGVIFNLRKSTQNQIQ